MYFTPCFVRGVWLFIFLSLRLMVQGRPFAPFTSRITIMPYRLRRMSRVHRVSWQLWLSHLKGRQAALHGPPGMLQA